MFLELKMENSRSAKDNHTESTYNEPYATSAVDLSANSTIIAALTTTLAHSSYIRQKCRLGFI